MQKYMTKNFKKFGLVLALSLFAISSVVYAGTLTPSATPAATSYTLTDIYTRLTTNASATLADHVFTPGGSPAASLYTLTQIYDSVPTIDATKVKLGQSYLGVAGSLVPNGGTATAAGLFNGLTAHLSGDWDLDTGTLDLACNTATFNGTANLVATAYDGTGDGTNRWCMKETGDATAGQIKTGAIAWVDGAEVTGSGTQTLSDASATVNAGYYEATTLDVVDSDLTAANILSGTTIFGVAGSLVPNGGTATAAGLFNGLTAHLSGDWDLDTGTLDLACNTATFNGTANLVATAYDGTGDGTNRWCMTNSGDAVAGEILSGKIAWVDGTAVTGIMTAGYTYGDATQAKVLTTATGAGTYDASNLAVGTVKSGTAFGVSLTGDYPSVTNPLSGDTGATDASATEICNGNEAWTKAGALMTGSFNPTAAYVATGNTYCGTAGTLLANLWNGTSGAFTGGSQANGGADDYNNAGAAASGRYAKGWTACNVGNSYCGTSDSGADAKDDSTGLVWSLPCNGSGCASFSDSSPLTYSWRSEEHTSELQSHVNLV